MAFKVSEHIVVPQHTKLKKEEKQALLEKYNITIRELPRILSSDPAIAQLKVGPGDVIKIVRKSATAGKADYYRVVISG